MQLGHSQQRPGFPSQDHKEQRDPYLPILLRKLYRLSVFDMQNTMESSDVGIGQWNILWSLPDF